MILEFLGRLLANYLNRPSSGYMAPATSSLQTLQKCLLPGDVLLVEGNLRVSTAIKYLTQSTWSHSALYVGNALAPGNTNREPLSLIEVDLRFGVVAVPLSKYENFHTRICRPVGLSEEDRNKMIQYAVSRIGNTYDLKNVIDLLRYLFPTPPLPSHWRRGLLALGSGEPTKAICSTLIGQAFQSIRYPILPTIRKISTNSEQNYMKEILHIRHHSLFTPRDFDISPYFQIIKPTIEGGFEYTKLQWE